MRASHVFWMRRNADVAVNRSAASSSGWSLVHATAVRRVCVLRRGCHWALRRATLWAGVGVGGVSANRCYALCKRRGGLAASVHYAVHGAVDPLAIASFSMSREEACILLERRGGVDLAELRT